MKINTVHSTYHLNHLRCHILPTPDFCGIFSAWYWYHPVPCWLRCRTWTRTTRPASPPIPMAATPPARLKRIGTTITTSAKGAWQLQHFWGFFLEGWGIIMNYENSTILRLKLVKGWIPCIEYNVRCWLVWGPPPPPLKQFEDTL